MFLESTEPSPQRMLNALREAPPADWSEDFLPFLEWCYEHTSALITTSDELNAAIALLFERLDDSPLLFSHRRFAPGDEISELVSRRLGARLQLLPSEGDRLVALEPFELVIGTHLGFLRPSQPSIPVRRVSAGEQNAIAAAWKLFLSLPDQPSPARHVLRVRFEKLLRTPNQDWSPLLQRLQRLTSAQRSTALERALAFQLRQSFPPERRPNFSGLQEDLAEHEILLEMSPLQKLVALASWLLEHIQPSPEVASGKVQLTLAELDEYLSWEGRAAHLYRFRSSEGVRCLNSLLVLLAEGQEQPASAQELLAELVELRETFLKRLKLRPLSLLSGLDPLVVLQARLKTPSEHLWTDVALLEVLLSQWEQLCQELKALAHGQLSWLEPSEPSEPAPSALWASEPLFATHEPASSSGVAEITPFESALPPPLPPSPGLPFDVTSFELPRTMPPRARELPPPPLAEPSQPVRAVPESKRPQPSTWEPARPEPVKPESKRFAPLPPPLDEVPLLGPMVKSASNKKPTVLPPPLFDDALGPVPSALKGAEEELDDGLLEDDDAENPDTVSVVVHLSEMPAAPVAPRAAAAEPPQIRPPASVMPEEAEELEVDESPPLDDEEEDGSERSVVVYLVNEEPEALSRPAARGPEQAPELPFAAIEPPAWAPAPAHADLPESLVETEEAMDELVEAAEDSVSDPALASHTDLESEAEGPSLVADDEAVISTSLEVVSLEHALQAHGRLLGEHGHELPPEGHRVEVPEVPTVGAPSLASLLEQQLAGAILGEPGAEEAPLPENIRATDAEVALSHPLTAQGEKLAGTLEQALYQGVPFRMEPLDPMSEHSFDEFSGPAFDSSEIFHADHDGARARAREGQVLRNPVATVPDAPASAEILPMPEADDDDSELFGSDPQLPPVPAGLSPDLELEADADGQAALPMPEDLEYDGEAIRGSTLSVPLKGLNTKESQSEQAAQIQAELDSLMDALEQAEPLAELEERGRPRLRIVPRPEPARIIDPLEMLDQAEQLLDEEQHGRSLVPPPAIHPDEWETPREVEEE